MRKRPFLIVGGLAILLLTLLPIPYVLQVTHAFRYSATNGLEELPFKQVALVLGAGVQPDGKPTQYLEERIETAVTLYKTHKVEALLMSGGPNSRGYDEPTVMKAKAISLGVPAEHINTDNKGLNTYASCSRAKETYKVTSMTIVTQAYHEPRAVYLCRSMGIDTIGVAALPLGRDFTVAYLFREILAIDKNVVLVAAEY